MTYQNGSIEDYGPGPKDYYSGTKCYSVEYYGDLRGEVGYSLQFGGPAGGSC